MRARRNIYPNVGRAVVPPVEVDLLIALNGQEITRSLPNQIGMLPTMTTLILSTGILTPRVLWTVMVSLSLLPNRSLRSYLMIQQKRRLEARPPKPKEQRKRKKKRKKLWQMELTDKQFLLKAEKRTERNAMVDPIHSDHHLLKDSGDSYT